MGNKRKIVIIGASIHQYELVKTAKDMNLETHVFAWNEGAVAKEISDFFYPISITSKEEILEVANQIKPIGVCTIGSDLAIKTVAFIASELGLTTNPEFSVSVTTNKYEMRKKLQEASLPIPKYKKISDLEESKSLSYPIMIKTVDRSGSRGIRLVFNDEEFKQAFKNAISFSFQDYVLVEEYFEGVQYSVESFSQNGKHYFIGLTEEFYTGPPEFVEEKHLMPGRIDHQTFLKVKEVIFKSLTALGIQNGASHSEIRVNENGELCIIEIAARMGGDFRYKLIELSYGIDYIKMVILNSIGENVEIPEPSKNEASIIKFILNEADFNQFELIRNSVHIIQSEIMLNEYSDNVIDSSQRFGYYIFKSKTSQDCLNVLDSNQ